MTLTLLQQQAIVIRYLPRTLSLIENMLHGSDLATMVQSRLASGDREFGSSMFEGKFSSSEARLEGVEELADAVLYLATWLYLCDGGDHG